MHHRFNHARSFARLAPSIAALVLLAACSSPAPAASVEDPQAPGSNTGSGDKKDSGTKGTDSKGTGDTTATPSPAGPPPPSTDDDKGPPDGIWPRKDDKQLYGAFDGTHPATLTLAYLGSKDAKWTSSDDTKVTISPGTTPQSTNPKAKPFNEIIVTPKAAGKFKITVDVAGKTDYLEINITAFTTAQYDAGKTRYTTKTSDTVAGQACSSCHGPDNPHDSWFLQYFSDAELTDIFTKALFPNAEPHLLPTHKFDPGAAQTAGIIAYLRTLTDMQKKTGN